jgi:ribosomal protein L11
MLRKLSLKLLAHRPKTAKTEPGSNRMLDEPFLTKAKDIFAVPEFPNKAVIHNWRFIIRSGKAATGPPLGAEFTKIGLKVMDFTKGFNDRTKPVFKDDVDLIVRIQVYFDKTFLYRIEPPPTAWFIMRAIRKKRRECATVFLRGAYTAYITLEMIYEIAKFKQISWGTPEYPPIETRARMIAGQCRRMGIALIGVDTHSSPVKGMSEKEYQAQCAKYRKIHWEQYEALRQQQLDAAPLIERLHRPNLSALSIEQLTKGVSDAKMFAAMWTATNPDSLYQLEQRRYESALQFLNTEGWFRDMSAEELRATFINWKLPETEKKRQLEGHAFQETYWDRDEMREANKKK